MTEPALDAWLAEALRAAGVADPGALAGPDAVAAVLDLARDAAHALARPAAPLSAFAAGMAVGRTGGGVDDLRAVAGRIAAAALAHSPEGAS